MRVGPTFRTFTLLIAGTLLSGDVHSQTTTSGGLAGVVIDLTLLIFRIQRFRLNMPQWHDPISEDR